MSDFLEFLFCIDTLERDPPHELRKDLEALGVNISRVENEVSSLLANFKEHSPAAQPSRALPSWVTDSRSKQAAFDKRLAVVAKARKRPEMLQAILGGSYGDALQSRAQVFFRNQKESEISEQDLQTFLEDCQLLGLIK